MADISVVASHQITREWREYERSSTTVLSAYVQPIAARYLDDLETGLRDGGYEAPLYIMREAWVWPSAASSALSRFTITSLTGLLLLEEEATEGGDVPPLVESLS